MGTIRVEAFVDVSGPLSDGRALEAIDEWHKRTTQALADQAVQMLGEVVMDKSGRSVGGFRESLHTVRLSISQVRVPGPTERGVSWAPWLEGTSRRNATTHFKGYGLFRATAKRLSERASDIGEQKLEEIMSEIGGE